MKKKTTAMADSGDEEEYEEQEDVRDNVARTVDDEEEDDEEEGQDEYEKDGFIVDEEEEEEPEEAQGSSDDDIKTKRKKRKRRGEEQYELDEDDYDLLQEANVTGFHRPPRADVKKKFKRLKKAGPGTGGKRSATIGSDEEDEEESGGRRGRNAEEELKRSLFGDDEGAAPEDMAEEEEMEEDDEEDEMADFIVDEEEVDEPGQPSKKRKKVKKKGFRQAPGINSIALQEAQEIFGDVSSLLEERRRRERDAFAGLDDEERENDDEDDDYGCGRRAPPQNLLEKQFEPSLLEEKFLTERDDQLRETDIPERLQILEEAADTLPSTDAATRQAADWIFDRAFGHLGLPLRPEFQHLSKMDKPEIVRQIANVLRLVHTEKVEIPFIAMYRCEECVDLIKEPSDEYENEDRPKIQHYEALWAVQQWDKKWLLLQRRKSALQAAYEKRIPDDTRNTPEKDDLVKKIFRALADAQSEQAIDDCDAKFNLHFPPDEVELVEGGFKRPKRRSLYSICRKAGLGSVAKHFGLAPDRFGENMQATYKRHDVEDEAYSPDDLATKFCAANRSANEFRNPASVLRSARHMMAVEMSTEPAVREYVRSFYTERAVVSTRPTSEGNDAIDAFHQYAGVKWLLNKPIAAFDDAQWLHIQKAEDEKLLQVTVGLPKDSDVNLLGECEGLYISDGVSLTAQQWNEQRKEILRDALVIMLLPSMEKEARMVLATRAKQWLAAKCASQLWNKVSVAPYVPAKASDNDDRNAEAPSLRVLACCWGPGNPATTFVMLDAAGEVLSVLYAGYLNIRASSPEQIQRKQNDQARLLQFMRDFQPHVVVLGAAHLNCRYLRQDIFEVTFKVVEQHPRDLAEGLDMIKVVYGDESIPALYENSKVSREQLPGQPGIVRRAVALGRFLQNPVAMVASLCGPTMEVLSLRLHPLQSCLTKEELYEAIERVMVTVTNQVGFDINLAASHEWIYGSLQFIAGFGPRKAGAIQRALQSVRRVGTRKDLYSSIRVMDKKVFVNSAGFIRVRGSGQAASGIQHLDPLDDTRIHPQSYQVAKNMAEAAYKEEAQQNEEEVDEELLDMAVEHVMAHPKVLNTIDIQEYARIVQENGHGRKTQKLELIKSELQHGFRDWRKAYVEPTEDECFYLLSGETEETLSPGRLVHATVRRVQQNRVMCVLESGLLGFIQKEDLSDDRDVELSDKVSEGSVVTCRVKEVKIAKCLVDLTCKGSDLRGDFWDDQQQRDKYYVQDTTFLRDEQEKARRKREEEKKKAFKPRMIVHPRFQNVSVDDAIKALAEKDTGDVIIRPSSKGPTHLSMTLKVHDGVYTHIDIAEGGKESRDLTSFLSLGKALTIGEESYEDLDEVMARYVDRMVNYMREIMRYRKYKQGTKQEIDDALRSDRAANPKRIPYYFSIAHDYPGAFMLSYIRAVNPHHEYISLSPSGFRFRKTNFDTIDKLVAFFQKHFNDPVPEPRRRAVSAMVAQSSYGSGGYGSQKAGANSRGGGRGGRRGGRNLGWGGRGGGSDGWGKGGGRSGGDNGGASSGWGNTEGSGKDKWDNAQSGGSNGGGAWEKGPVATSSGGGAWDSRSGGGGGDWGDRGATTSNPTAGDTWESGTKAAGGGQDGWDTLAASTGGWDAAQGGGPSGSGGEGGDRDGGWNQGGQDRGGDRGGGGGGRDGGWNQGGGGSYTGAWDQGADCGGQKTNGWGSDLPPPSQKPAQDSWKDGRSTTTGGRSGWDTETNTTGGGGDGWDAQPASTGGWDALPASTGGWDSVQGEAKSGSGGGVGDGEGGWNQEGRGRGGDRGGGGGGGGDEDGGWKQGDQGRGGDRGVDRDGGWNQGGRGRGRGGGRGGRDGDRGGGWNQGGQGRSSDRGGWNQGGRPEGEKTTGWGSDMPPPSPARKPAQDGWKDGGSTALVGGSGWDTETNTTGGGGDGWDAQPASTGGWDALPASTGGWDSVQGEAKSGSGGGGGDGEGGWNQEGRGRGGDRGGGGGDEDGGWKQGGQGRGGDRGGDRDGGWNQGGRGRGRGGDRGGRDGDRDGGWNQGGQGRGSDRGDWNQGGRPEGEKTTGWGSDMPPPSPARKPAQDGWKDGGSTALVGGSGWGTGTDTTGNGWDALLASTGGRDAVQGGGQSESGGQGGDTDGGWNQGGQGRVGDRGGRGGNRDGGWNQGNRGRDGDRGDRGGDTDGGWNQGGRGRGGYRGGQGGNRDGDWNQGGRGRGGDRGGWDRGGGRGGGKSNGWGSDLPPASPARKPAQDGWKDGGSTPGRDLDRSTPAQGNAAGTPARVPPPGGSMTSGGDWGASTDSAAPGSQMAPEKSSNGWCSEKSSRGASGWGDGKDAEKSSGWGDGKDAGKSSGWGDEKDAENSSGWGKGKEVENLSGWGDGKEAEKSSGSGDGKDAEKSSRWGDEKDAENSSEWGKGKEAEKSSGWGDGKEAEKSSGSGDGKDAEKLSGWGDDKGNTITKVGTGWDDNSQPPASSSDWWGQPTGKSGGGSGWEVAGKKDSESDGSGWDAVPQIANSWGTGIGGDSPGGWGQQEEARGTDGGWNARPSQGGWGGRGQDSRDRGRGRSGDRGDRGGWGGQGLHSGNGRHCGSWDR